MSTTKMFQPTAQVFVRAWVDDQGVVVHHWPTVSMPLRVFSRVAIVQPVGSPEWWLVNPRTLTGVRFDDEDAAVAALAMGMEP